MKKFLLLFGLFVFTASSSQSIHITGMSATAATGGIDVNVKTISFNGAGYLSHTYTITGNTIDLSVCYYFNMLLPVLTFDDTFFIPVTEAGNYTVNVTVYNSSSTVECDYFSSGGSATTTILSTNDFSTSKALYVLYPNPTNGVAEFGGDNTVDKITVYDHLGKLVKEDQNILVNKIDFSGLSEGLYLVRMSFGKQSFTQQILKQ